MLILIKNKNLMISEVFALVIFLVMYVNYFTNIYEARKGEDL